MWANQSWVKYYNTCNILTRFKNNIIKHSQQEAYGFGVRNDGEGDGATIHNLQAISKFYIYILKQSGPISHVALTYTF